MSTKVITPEIALELSKEAQKLRQEYHKRVLRMWDVSEFLYKR